MKRTLFLSSLLLSCLTTTLNAADQKIAIVNFKKCLEDSQIGKDERARFEKLKKDLETALEAKEKQLNELAPKFNQEYLDTLTPEAENELKAKFRQLSQELSQDQNQYYQMLNQANMQVVQKISEMIETASKKIAQAKKYDIILNDEATFYFNDSSDISKDIVAELNQLYQQEKDKVAKEQEKQAQKK